MIDGDVNDLRFLDQKRKKPYLDWDTEARPLYDWSQSIKNEVLKLLGFSLPA